jgi:glycosyltransferase
MKISIITVFFNSISTLKQTLNSINKQNYDNIEKIWIDGGSNDGTVEFLNSKKDKRTILVSENDRGIFDAMNKGIQKSTGEIIGFLHSDDFYSRNDIIKKIASTFIANKKINLVYGDLLYVKKKNIKKVLRFWKAENNYNDTIKNKRFYSQKLNNGWMPPHPTVFVRKNFLDKIGFFNIKYKVSSDYDFMIRCFKSSYLFAKYLPCKYVHMRSGGNSNKSLINLFIKYKEDYIIAKSHNLSGVYTVLMKNLTKINQFFVT